MDPEQLKFQRVGEASTRLRGNIDFNVFLDAIREQADIVAYNTLISGCDSFEDYQKQRGMYLGFRQVLDACDTNIADMEEYGAEV